MSDATARTHVDSKDQIKPALLGVDVGDVALPEPARALGRGNLCQPVFGDLMIMAALSCARSQTALLPGAQPTLPHEPGNPGSWLSAPDLAGYVGINDRIAVELRPGRSLVAPVELDLSAYLIGSHGYLGQENRQIGFRTYFREKAPTFRILEPAVCSDDPEIAYKETIEMLHGSEKLV